PGTDWPERPLVSLRAAWRVRIDWFSIAIPAPVPIVQFAPPPVAFTVMRRAAELCCTAAASCCSSPVSDGLVLTVGVGLAAGVGLATVLCGGGGAAALAGLVPGGPGREREGVRAVR